MPRDTPPPIPRGNKRRRGEGNANANLESLGTEERVQHELPKKPEAPAPRITYEAKPLVRDLRKEAVRAFVPAAVARKAAAAKGGVGERLLEEEEVQKLEREGYIGGTRKGQGNGASAGGTVVDAAPAVDGGGGEDEQTRLDEEAERFSREVRMEEVSDEDL